MHIKHRYIFPLLVTSIFSNATPLHSRNSLRVKHQLSSVPTEWSRLASPPANQILSLEIGIKQSRADDLIHKLHKISDPDHEEYGNYLSSDELRSFIQPGDDSITLVKDWLVEHGFNDKDMSFTSHKDWIQIEGPLDVIEGMLGTEYHIYQHENGIDHALQALSYSLPEYLHDHIDVVHPTTYFSTARGKPKKPNDNTQALQRRIIDNSNEMIPNSIFRTLYKTIGYVPKATDINKFAVVGFSNEVAIRTDLQLFLADERQDAIGADFVDVFVNGGSNNQTLNRTQLENGIGEEGNLDMQTAIGVTYPTPIQFLSVYGLYLVPASANQPNETAYAKAPFLPLIHHLLSLPDDELPRTVTVSYGDLEQNVPLDFANRICDGFAQVGSRGVSVLFASGDSGVGPDVCQSNDGKNTTMFLPDFPSTCPYVTSVGATRDFFPEVAEYDDFYSGGGFSNIFSRPSYQKAAVSKYLQGIGDLNKGLYNSSGRGYPDVAAQGHKYKIYWNAAPRGIGGTSASTPMFSSVVALLNDHLLSQNKKPLGFLNPFLYKKGYEGLNDILQGASQGCNTTGFPAAPGWDAVTGLGTPDFQKLLKLVDSA